MAYSLNDPLAVEAWARRFRFRNQVSFVLVTAMTLFLTSLLAERVFRYGFFLLGIPLLLLALVSAWLLANRLLVTFVGWMVLSHPTWQQQAGTVEWESEGHMDSTAILLPVRNEPVARVAAALGAMYRSLAATGRLAHFHFFILSDTDEPSLWLEEEAAWHRLCTELGAHGRIFYRHRDHRVNAKQGNVADFLRCWGRSYRYMIVLDADSVMTGPAMVKLVVAMERHPQVGLIQLFQQLVCGETLYARLTQWAHSISHEVMQRGIRLFGPVGSAYFGHNAIIRVAPFLEHCGLPDFPGEPPWGGRVLGHDHYEAALLRRAGWELWLVDIPGSYEEEPPTLYDRATREGRWLLCVTQHCWLLFARGFGIAERLDLFMRPWRYLRGPLWLAAGAIAVLATIAGRSGQSARIAAFFHWSEPGPQRVLDIALMASVAVLLFGPWLISWYAVARDADAARRRGGQGKILLSGLLFAAANLFNKPIQLYFAAKSVGALLLGHPVKWKAQRRAGAGDEFGWREAWRCHGEQTVVGLVLLALITWMRPYWLGWAIPALLGLACAVPWAVFLGRASIGQKVRQWGLFLTPEECDPPTELEEILRVSAERGTQFPVRDWRAAMHDSGFRTLHLSLLRDRARSQATREYFAELRVREAMHRPGELTRAEVLALLRDRESVEELGRSARDPAAAKETAALAQLAEVREVGVE